MGKYIRVDVSGLRGAIDKLLKEYGDECADVLREVAPQCAKDAVKELKGTSPVGRTGRYARGWEVDTQKTRLGVECTVHNATDYQLTHLLEKGHVTRRGGRTKALTHIAPVNDTIQEKFINEVEKRLRQ